jgi:predicted O-methyltransferase YrrM
MHFLTVLKPGKGYDRMHSSLKLAVKYIRHQILASNGNGHGIHSPFVFEFVKKVLKDKKKYPAYIVIEKLRKRLLSDNTAVPIEDYGARSSRQPIASCSVAGITANAAKSPRYAQLLYRIVKYYGPHYVLELGTSLGISTAYLAAGDERSAVITGEGNHMVAALAKNNFKGLGLKNIRIVTGNFDNTLPGMIAVLPQVDLAFIDGNHREDPTLNYFKHLLDSISPSSILIFDDIYWSGEMESAWKRIQEHPSVMLTIDLFRIGIVFFRPEFKVKQHFRIRF